MDHNYYLNEQSSLAHRKELKRKARHERLVREARAARPKRCSVLLAGLGSRLMNWGARLQARYGAEPVAYRPLAAISDGRSNNC